jgi:hypothetical protein
MPYPCSHRYNIVDSRFGHWHTRAQMAPATAGEDPCPHWNDPRGFDAFDALRPLFFWCATKGASVCRDTRLVSILSVMCRFASR